jgi:tetratricopeptide (TPR) repeat protein
LRHREPVVLPEDQEELCELLRKLAESARERLHDVGLEPEYAENDEAQKLPKREREYVANMAAILTYLAMVVEHEGMRSSARYDTVREALAWCKVAHDYRQQAILWRIAAAIHQGDGELVEEENACRKSIEAARRSQEPAEIVAALDVLCSLLVVRQRLDEAEEVNEEARGVLREELAAESRGIYYPSLLMNSARIKMYRTQYAEGIKILREALRWADGDTNPKNRAAIMTHLGSVYLRLEHYQQSIECQHEVVRLAEVAGSESVRGWGYYRLAEAHLRLNELDQTKEMLDRAEAAASETTLSLKFFIAAKRAQLFTATERYDEAVDLCAGILDAIGDQAYPDLRMYAHKTLGEIEERRFCDEEAEAHYRRAIEVSDREFPPRSPALQVRLAEVLYRLGRRDEVVALLDEIARSNALNPSEQVMALRLRASLAEDAGEVRRALDYERQAFTVERSLLERRAELSLRNARIVAETDLLEREAELERERRYRVERELAEATVALGDKKRVVEMIEQKLRDVLEGMDSRQERAAVKTLRETLASLRSQPYVVESPLRYLSSVDDEFYRRLRKKYPDLTSKQERLCGLLRAGLSSKEIASLLGLEAEGLKAQRKRLRKRLNLDMADRLETVLAEV